MTRNSYGKRYLANGIRQILRPALTRRSENSHLVSVDAVIVEEMSSLFVDLSRTILITPEMEETFVHRPRAKARHLSQVTWE